MITVNSFCEFTNKLIEILQWIVVSMIPFVANTVFIYWFAMNCLIITNTMNITKILQTLKFNVFLHGYFLQWTYYLIYEPCHENKVTNTQIVE